jgi:glucose/arabinose dehydrogenase
MAAGASAQNLFVSNYSNGDIYQITPGGTQTLFASGMANPYGLAFNSAGDLFIGNSDNNDNSGGTEGGNITEITPSGTQTTFASGVDPQGLAFNSAGDLFEADYDSGNIYEYTPNGVKSTYATGFSLPLGLAFNSAGDLFVGSGYGSGNGTITEITPAETKNVFASGLYFPTALAFNNAGDLFEADLGSGTIYEFTGGVQSTFASVSAAEGLTFNGAGNLFVSSSAGSIVEITPKGEETTLVSDAGDLDQVAFQPVPEPSVLGLLGASAAVFMLCRRAGKSRAERA